MKRYLEFINEEFSSNEELIDYAGNGNLRYAKRALDNGADIHFANDAALYWAIVYNHLNMVKYLVDQGADIHASDHRSLKTAIAEDHSEIVKYLCEYIIQNKPWDIPKIIQYIPEELKEKYAHLFAASDMDLL